MFPSDIVSCVGGFGDEVAGQGAMAASDKG